MERPTCGTCPYFHGHGKPSPEEAERLNIGDSELGECMRYPPQIYSRPPHPHLKQERHRVSVEESRWPEVHDFDFCGEHPDFPAYIEGRKWDGDCRVAAIRADLMARIRAAWDADVGAIQQALRRAIYTPTNYGEGERDATRP